MRSLDPHLSSLGSFFTFVRPIGGGIGIRVLRLARGKQDFLGNQMDKCMAYSLPERGWETPCSKAARLFLLPGYYHD